jgi:CBS domain-containing protein
MTRKVIKIDYDKSVLEASYLYQKYKIGSLVVTKNDECVGIITERNIIERTICAGRSPGETKVGEIMTSDIITIDSMDNLEKAIDVMIKHNVKKLPAIMKNEIIGIITVTDISRARPDLSKRFMDSWVRPRWRD